jgi:predicted nucleic acid-binding Zn ribbon protein
MTKEKLKSIQEAELTNNCPECFNQDMTLTFYQKHVYGRLYHRITSEISHELRCNKCGSPIYPVKWTDDIERTFEYYQKLLRPERASVRFTMLFYALLLILIAIIAALVYLWMNNNPI